MSNIKLSVRHQYEFESLSEVGCSVVDALMVGAGFTPAEAEKARDDAGLLAIWEQARARGASRILDAMSKAAAAGSSSAAKLVLDSNAAQVVEQEERVRDNRRRGHGKTIDVSVSVKAGFDELRRVRELYPDEIRTAHISANGRVIYTDGDKSNG